MWTSALENFLNLYTNFYKESNLYIEFGLWHTEHKILIINVSIIMTIV